MEFEWDPAKSDACFEERGFDFAFALRTFVDPDRIVRKDIWRDYGEERYQLLGMIENSVFFVTYTMRGVVIRIISARKANRREVNDYETSTRQD